MQDSLRLSLPKAETLVDSERNDAADDDGADDGTAEFEVDENEEQDVDIDSTDTSNVHPLPHSHHQPHRTDYYWMYPIHSIEYEDSTPRAL